MKLSLLQIKIYVVLCFSFVFQSDGGIVQLEPWLVCFGLYLIEPLKKLASKRKCKFTLGRSTTGEVEQVSLHKVVEISDTLGLKYSFIRVLLGNLEPVFYCLPDQESYFVKLPLGDFFSDDDKKKIRSLYKEKVSNSKHTWWGREEVNVDYEFGGKNHKKHTYDQGLVEMENFFQALTTLIMCMFSPLIIFLKGLSYRGFNLVRYWDFRSLLGFHQDDEKIFNSRIICSFSMYNSALFKIRDARTHEIVHEEWLNDFDVCFMVGSKFQQHYEHAIKKSTGFRMNVTYRHILRKYLR